MLRPLPRNQPLAAKSVASLLHEPGALGVLAARARTLLRAEHVVERTLGTGSRAHVRVAGLSDVSVLLCADSPAWATLARFRGPDICAGLRAEFPRIREARVFIGSRARPTTPSVPRPSLSPAAARLLRRTAGAIDNPRLARVLNRLAGHEPRNLADSRR